MVTTKQNSLLGVGVYSPREAARYMRVNAQKFRRWIYGHGNRQPVFEPDIPREGAREIVTFLDFAQALYVQDIRLNIAVPLQRIREAYYAALNEYGVTHPFARKYGVFVFGNLNDPRKCVLGLYPGEALGEEDETKEFLAERAIQLTGKKKGNFLIHQVVQEFSRRLEFSAEGVADEYVAFESFGHRILMQPDVRFGKPYIEGLVYEAETLASAAEYEGGISRAADLYETPESAVRAAVEYMRELDREPHRIQLKTLSA